MGIIEINRVHYKLWDIGGRADMHALWLHYYSDAHAIIFVLDATDNHRIFQMQSVFGNSIV